MSEAPREGQAQRWRHAVLASLAAVILALLALLSWPRGLAGRELIREDLRQLHSSEWSLARNEPGRMQSFAALGLIVQDLLKFVDTSGAHDRKALRDELNSYATQADSLSTSRNVRDEQLFALRDQGMRISRMFEEGMTDAVLAAGRWRLVLFGWSALLMALLAVGARRLMQAERRLARGVPVDADRGQVRIAELEHALARSEAARAGAEQARAAAELAQRLGKALDGPNVRLSETRFTTPVPAGAARVLLAEDGEDNRRLIQHLVKRVGLELCTVENGAEALREVERARDAGQPFDLLLMDMQMPVLDGYSAVQRLRELGVRAPIMALTANAMTSDRQRCLDAGCDEFCAKPIDFDQFFAGLDRCLALGRARTPAALPQHKPIEKPAVEDKGFAQLVEQFVRELGDEALALRARLSQGDLRELARLAHQLKGSCGSYGFPELSRHAAELERCVKTEAGQEAISMALAAFEKGCADVRSSASV